MILGRRHRLPEITGEADLGLVEQYVGSAKIESVIDNQVRCVPFLDNTVQMKMVDELPSDTPNEFIVRCRPLPIPDDEAPSDLEQ